MVKDLAIACLCCVAAASAEPSWQLLKSGATTSIRGIDAVDADTCWIGTKGGVARTTDGGKTWQFMRVGPQGDEQALDFRDLEAFNARRCVAMSVGPGGQSRVYLTKDGGSSWTLAYQNMEPKGFFNGVVFRDEDEGILAGDPVEGRLFLLATKDGGETWKRIAEETAPQIGEGEHSFAAGGTHLAANRDGHLCVTSGGKIARVFLSKDWGESWTAINSPMISGEPSTGIFSIAFSPADPMKAIAVGGDYKKEEEGLNNAMVTSDGGRSWRLLKSKNGGAPFPFRSCIGYLDAETLVTVGPSGSNLSRDGGSTWHELEGESGFHALSISGNWVWAAGAGGRVGRLLWKED